MLTSGKFIFTVCTAYQLAAGLGDVGGLSVDEIGLRSSHQMKMKEKEVTDTDVSQMSDEAIHSLMKSLKTEEAKRQALTSAHGVRGRTKESALGGSLGTNDSPLPQGKKKKKIMRREPKQKLEVSAHGAGLESIHADNDEMSLNVELSDHGPVLTGSNAEEEAPFPTSTASNANMLKYVDLAEFVERLHETNDELLEEHKSYINRKKQLGCTIGDAEFECDDGHECEYKTSEGKPLYTLVRQGSLQKTIMADGMTYYEKFGSSEQDPGYFFKIEQSCSGQVLVRTLEKLDASVKVSVDACTESHMEESVELMDSNGHSMTVHETVDIQTINNQHCMSMDHHSEDQSEHLSTCLTRKTHLDSKGASSMKIAENATVVTVSQQEFESLLLEGPSVLKETLDTTSCIDGTLSSGLVQRGEKSSYALNQLGANKTLKRVGSLEEALTGKGFAIAGLFGLIVAAAVCCALTAGLCAGAAGAMIAAKAIVTYGVTVGGKYLAEHLHNKYTDAGSPTPTPPPPAAGVNRLFATYMIFPGFCQDADGNRASGDGGAYRGSGSCQDACTQSAACTGFEFQDNKGCYLFAQDAVAKGSGSQSAECYVKKTLTTVYFGNSNAQKKCVWPLAAVGMCESDAGDADKRFSGGDAGDTFLITVEGNQVCAQRTDRNAGWGMVLEIMCYVQVSHKVQDINSCNAHGAAASTITSADGCKAAAASLGITYGGSSGLDGTPGTWSHTPPGCFVHKGCTKNCWLHFSTGTGANNDGNFRAICKSEFRFTDGGDCGASMVMSEAGCKEAARRLAFSYNSFQTGDWTWTPPGCFVHKGCDSNCALHYGTGTGSNDGRYRALCTTKVEAFVTSGSCTIEGGSGCAMSPNYPSNYGNDQECAFEMSGTIGEVEFAAENNYDKLKHGDKEFTGSTAPVPGDTATGSWTWTSDFSITKRGWKICPFTEAYHIAYVLGSGGSNQCPDGMDKITTAAKCNHAAQQLAGQLTYHGEESMNGRPGGCWAWTSGVYFNDYSPSWVESWARPLCSKACGWDTFPGTYSGGYAGGVTQTFDNADAAKTKCIALGSSTCKAVTCASGSSLAGSCTVRAVSYLSKSHSGETTYMPNSKCSY